MSRNCPGCMQEVSRKKLLCCSRKKDWKESLKSKFKAKQMLEVLKGNPQVFLEECFEENLKGINYDFACILVREIPKKNLLRCQLSCKCLFIQIHVLRKKREIWGPFFVLLFFSAGIRHTSNIHSPKAKKSTVSWWILKLTDHLQKHRYNVAMRECSEKRAQSLLLLGLFQHPSGIIWNYQNSLRSQRRHNKITFSVCHHTLLSSQPGFCHITIG